MSLKRIRQKLLPLLLMLALFASFAPRLRAQTVPPPESAAHSDPESQIEQDENYKYTHSAMVQKFGHMMGMEPDRAATVFELADFAMLVLALGFVMVKMLPKWFRDRSSAIQKDLVDARTATEQASLRLTGVEDRLAALDGQIAEMHAQAEKDAAAEEKRMRAAVADEKTRILAAAEQEIASASLAAQRSLQRYAAELAIEQASRKLMISAETDRLLVQGFARRLAGQNPEGGQN